MKSHLAAVLTTMAFLCCLTPPAPAMEPAIGCEVVLFFNFKALTQHNKILNETDFGYPNILAFDAARLQEFRDRSHGSGTYFVTGDADAKEHDTASHSLAKGRAIATRAWLMSLGVSSAQIVTMYFDADVSPTGEIDLCSDACTCTLSPLLHSPNSEFHSFIPGP